MLPNWTGWKTVKLILAILTTCAGAVASSPGMPAAVVQAATIATTLLGIATSIVVVLSGTAAGPAVVANMTRGAGAVLLLMAIGATQTACVNPAIVVPPLIATATCVADDAIAHKTLAQIVADCGGDAVAVITALLTSAKPEVQGSTAYGEAKALKARLAAMP
jgi:hypothetical protein